ncbi:MAG: hypothetical protein J6D42_00340 [Clostridia bacterium]|nr:hypothetical protein [Clostridia bacterium]
MVEKPTRILVIMAIFLIIIGVFILQLIKLQLIDGEEYLEASRNSVITKTTVDASRGEILDRFCSPIVQSSSVMTVEFNRSIIKNLNATIDTVLDIFEKCGEEYTDDFPISKTEPYIYYEDFLSSSSKVSSFSSWLKKKKIAANITAEDALAALIKYYKLSDYPTSRARDIIAIRYGIENKSTGYFYTFAEDVGLETITMVKERGTEIPGVTVEIGSARSYVNERFASHIIGYVGKINAEEYEVLKDSGYSINDTLGKDGIEKIAEDWLRGTDGYKYAQTDKSGNVVDIIEDVEPIAGNDVILTISTDMQKITEAGLAEVIRKLKEQNGEEAANSGAAIFMDVHSGEIYSMASYPTYNLSTYFSDFSTLSKDPGKPYVNRAISGLFPPGSTYKMLTGIAGLEEEVITQKTTYKCGGYYTYYETYQPSCFAYTAHGNMDIYTAIKKSCNGYFFDVGRLLTIDKLSHYGSLFGFGQKTGIELPGESKGTLASKEYLESLGETWQAADTILTAIGQSYTTATPLQLVNYVATIANGGTRYQPFIIKAVRNRTTGEIVSETEPKVVEKIDLKKSTVDAILEGMRMAAMEKGGSAYSGFEDFKITTIAVKTGTAETTGIPTSLMVGVAPAEDPEIAFAIVIENGGLSASPINAELVKDVLSYYFSEEERFISAHNEGQLIS